jgi:hypothetical protein
VRLDVVGHLYTLEQAQAFVFFRYIHPIPPTGHIGPLAAISNITEAWFS